MTALRQVAHVLAKDLRVYRWWLGVYGLAIVAAIAVIAGSRVPSPAAAVVIAFGVSIAAGITLATVTQADSPVSPRAFWSTRPLSPMSVMAAKAGFAVGLLALALAGQAVALALLSAPGSQIPVVLAESAPGFLHWLVVAMLAGALTQSVRVFVLVEVGLVLVGSAGNAMGSEAMSQSWGLGAFVTIARVVLWCGLIGIAVATYSGRARQPRQWLAALFVLLFVTALGEEIGIVGGADARAVAITTEPPTLGLPQFTLALSPTHTGAADSIGHAFLGILLSVRVAALGGASVAYDSSLVMTSTTYAAFHGYARKVGSSWRGYASAHDAVFDTVRATLQLDVATLTLGDGSTLTIPPSARLVGLTDPDPLVMSDVRTGTGSVNSGGDVLLSIDASRRVAASGGVRSIALDGRVYLFRPRLAAVLPLDRGAHVQHGSNAVRIADWSYAEGVGHMVLDTKRLVSPANEASGTQDLGGWFAYYVIGDTTCAIRLVGSGCVHGTRDFSRLFAREYDESSQNIILPGWNIDWGTASNEAYIQPSDSTAQHRGDAWLRAARLMVVEWVPQGSYAVHLRTATP